MKNDSESPTGVETTLPDEEPPETKPPQEPRRLNNATESSTSPTITVQQKTATATGGPPRSARPGGWRYTFSSLSNRSFLFLWLGMLAMMGGMQMQMLARGYLVFDLTGSAALLGLVNAGSAIPMLGLALFGGVIADRIERKRIIQVGQAGAALLALIVAFAIFSGRIEWYHLLGASIVQGALFAFMMPARQAIIPQLVGKDHLTNAMALSAAGMAVTTLVAPAIAGGLYAFGGPDYVYFVIAGLGIISVVLTGFIPHTGSGQSRRSAPMMKDIIAGLDYIRHNRIVLVLLLMGLATSLLAMPFRFLMPVFVVDIYHRGPESMGLLVAVMGAGSLVGSLYIASLGKWRRGLLLIIGSLLSGIALILLAVFPFYYVAAGLMILLGLGDAGRRTLNQSLIMEEVEDQYRGRVMSVFMMNSGLMPLGVLPAGFVADKYGGQVAIGMLAIMLLVVTALIFVTQRRLREMQ